MCIQVHQTFSCKDVDGNTVQHTREHIIRCSAPDLPVLHYSGPSARPCLAALDHLYQEYRVQCPDCTGKGEQQTRKEYMISERCEYAEDAADDSEGGPMQRVNKATRFYHLSLTQLLVGEFLAMKIVSDGVTRHVNEDWVSRIFGAAIPELSCYKSPSHDYAGSEYLGSGCGCESRIRPHYSNIASAIRRAKATSLLNSVRGIIGYNRSRGHFVDPDTQDTAQIEVRTRLAEECQFLVDEISKAVAANEESDASGFAEYNRPFDWTQLEARRMILENKLAEYSQFGSQMSNFEGASPSGTAKERTMFNMIYILSSDVGLTNRRMVTIFERYLPVLFADEYRDIYFPEEQDDEMAVIRFLNQPLVDELDHAGPDMASRMDCNENSKRYGHGLITCKARDSFEKFGGIVAELAIIEPDDDKVNELVIEEECCSICYNQYLSKDTSAVERPVRLARCAAGHHVGRRCLTRLAITALTSDFHCTRLPNCPLCRVPFLNDREAEAAVRLGDEMMDKCFMELGLEMTQNGAGETS